MQNVKAALDVKDVLVLVPIIVEGIVQLVVQGVSGIVLTLVRAIVSLVALKVVILPVLLRAMLSYLAQHLHNPNGITNSILLKNKTPILLIYFGKYFY